MSQIDSPVSILDDTGNPAHFGWARDPHFQYDPDAVMVSRWRISESDRYVIFSPTHMVIFEIIDNGLLGYSTICMVSLRDKKRFTFTSRILFPLGSIEMPPSIKTGSIRLHKKNILLDFISMKSGARIIKVDIPQFDHHRSMRGEVVLLPPCSAESLATVMPWRRDQAAFRYALYSPWFSAEGVLQLGTTETAFTKGNAWGIFDWTRGVRPKNDTRYWAAACGIAAGKRIGINVGYDSADSEQGTGNAFFIEGTLHKLNHVTFHISPSNWLDPWYFTSNDNRIEMTFTPEMEWEDSNRTFFYTIKRRQLYGSFHGNAKLDDGSAINFKITGFAERRKMRF
ncbi:MAG: DUF2804 domain-containing protein [Treponema sp.]|jgi:hypothetical protein|nr:DUF2804 domain-containing protein [Treponema sp.]